VSIVHRNRTMHTNVSNASEASVFVPVEIPRRAPKNNDVAVCVKAAYHKIDHRRLVEWFELQRLLGVTSIGVYTTPLTHPDTRKTVAQYGRTWLSTQRTATLTEDLAKDISGLLIWRASTIVCTDTCTHIALLQSSISTRYLLYSSRVYANKFVGHLYKRW